MKQININYVDVFGNLLILLMKNDINNKSIPYTLINSYQSVLNNELSTKGYEATFNEDIDEIAYFFSKNKEFFEVSKVDCSINIIKDMPEKMLRMKCQTFLPAEILSTLLEKKVLVKTLQVYKEELLKQQKKKLKD